MTSITVAALQLALSDSTDANIARVSELVREAAGRGAQVVLPPELFEGHYFCQVEDEALFARARPTAEHPRVVAMQALAAELRRDHPFLAEALARRLVRQYGTRARAVLGDARSMADLGRDLGAGLTEREEAAAELGKLLVECGAETIEPAQLRQLVRASMALGIDETLKRIAPA